MHVHDFYIAIDPLFWVALVAGLAAAALAAFLLSRTGRP